MGNVPGFLNLRSQIWQLRFPTEVQCMTATLEVPTGAGLRALPELLTASEGWAGLRAALVAGHSGTIDGAWGSAAALAAATLAADTPGTLLIILPNPADPAPWAAHLNSFTGIRPAV